MFTGLIEDVGTIRETRGGEGLRLVVGTRIPMEELKVGESIAVNGVCLTLTSFSGGFFTADVSPETVERTTLCELAPGCRVNLERALKLSDRLGGHLVTGHVDVVSTVLERKQDRNAVRFTISLPDSLRGYVVEKGSITVDGISLTVNAVTEESFSLAIIPHTLAETNLRDAVVGSRVNIETDIIGKYVENLLKYRGRTDVGNKPLDVEFLAKHGFL